MPWLSSHRRRKRSNHDVCVGLRGARRIVGLVLRGAAMTLYELAQRMIGEVHERPGADDDPFIRWCHGSTTLGESPDEVPWCSSFVNRLAWLCRLPRSKSAAARSWLTVGQPVALPQARPGDVVVLRRGTSPTAGHVGIFQAVTEFAGERSGGVEIIGGNQNNGVTVAVFPVADILGIRRLT